MKPHASCRTLTHQGHGAASAEVLCWAGRNDVCVASGIESGGPALSDSHSVLLEKKLKIESQAVTEWALAGGWNSPAAKWTARSRTAPLGRNITQYAVLKMCRFIANVTVSVCQSCNRFTWAAFGRCWVLSKPMEIFKSGLHDQISLRMQIIKDGTWQILGHCINNLKAEYVTGDAH